MAFTEARFIPALFANGLMPQWVPPSGFSLQAIRHNSFFRSLPIGAFPGGRVLSSSSDFMPPWLNRFAWRLTVIMLIPEKDAVPLAGFPQILLSTA
jgi:hypothetical protein